MICLCFFFQVAEFAIQTYYQDKCIIGELQEKLWALTKTEYLCRMQTEAINLNSMTTKILWMIRSKLTIRTLVNLNAFLFCYYNVHTWINWLQNHFSLTVLIDILFAFQNIAYVYIEIWILYHTHTFVIVSSSVNT